MNYENLKWINQSLYTFNDKAFDSHGYLDISINISTEDDINFSQPKLVLNLENQGQRRNIRLTRSNVIDLVESLTKVRNNIQTIYQNPQTGDITKRYNNNKDLVIEFRAISSQPVVVLKIIHNTSDAGKIIFPLKPELTSIINTLEMFVQDFINISTAFPMRYLSSLSLNRLQEIQNSLIILPSQLVPLQPELYKDTPNPASSTEPETTQVLSYTNTRCALCGEEQYETPSGITCKNGHGGAESIIDEPPIDNEFDQFATDNVDKVHIPELEGEVLERDKPIAQEYNSPFIQVTLKNNILNLEGMLNALYTNNDPLRTIMNTIYNGEGYKLLPGISEQDLKSVSYISNLYFKLHFHSYIQNQTIFPIAIPVVKYLGDDSDRATVELSYDLMMLQAYLKLYRNRMESINSDAYTNGSLINFSFRCFLDVASYSYLNGKNSEAVKNNVISRFKYFRETGFFDHYDKNLTSENQKPIYDSEIGDFIDKVFDNVVESDDIHIRHFNAHDAGSVKLPSKNTFTLEQITNEIVKYEIKTMFGQRIEDLTTNEEIIILFNTKLKKKYKPTDHKPEPRLKETHVVRYIKLKANELPENIRQELIDYVIELGDITPYDYFNEKFKLEELPSVILKSLYTWNENIEEKMKYTDYASMVEECIDRDMIISKIKVLEEEVEIMKLEEESNDDSLNEEAGKSDWAGSFDQIEF
jgi:hypothetical protein